MLQGTRNSKEVNGELFFLRAKQWKKRYKSLIIVLFLVISGRAILLGRFKIVLYKKFAKMKTPWNFSYRRNLAESKPLLAAGDSGLLG